MRGRIYELFAIHKSLKNCLREPLKSFFKIHTQNVCLIGEKIINIIFGGYIFLCLSEPYNSNYDTLK